MVNMNGISGYAERVKEERVIMSSSSGGIFDFILNQGGAVACSLYAYKKYETSF